MADKQFIIGVARTKQIAVSSSATTQRLNASVNAMLAQSNEVYKGDFATAQSLKTVSARIGDYADVFETNSRWAKTSTGWEDTHKEILINPKVATKQDLIIINERLDNYVPQRLSPFKETSGFRQQAYIYADDGKQGFRMSMESVKDLNTKIVCADSLETVDGEKITKDDYIYVKK